MQIPQVACDEIVKHCKLEFLDWDELRKQTELIGYPVLPVVKQLVKGVNDVEAGLGEWAHWVSNTPLTGDVLLASSSTDEAHARVPLLKM